MTDPTDELLSFQQALIKGEIRLRAGEVDPELYVYADQTGDTPRFIYVQLIGLIVTAYAVMEMSEPEQDLPCFQASVAVPQAYRGKGYAKSILQAALAELKNGLSRNNARSFYLKAIVGVHDEAAKKVTQSIMPVAPQTVTDAHSGLLVLEYACKI